MAKILMILAPQGYQDIEYGEPRAVLEAAGHQVFTSSTVEVAQGKLGGSTTVDILLNEVNPDDYDAVVFVGGPGSRVYFEDATTHAIAKAFHQAGKLTCAICAGPGILAHSGLLKGKTSTCYETVKETLESLGAHYTGQPVEKDGNVITANGPNAAKAFGEKIASCL